MKINLIFKDRGERSSKAKVLFKSCMLSCTLNSVAVAVLVSIVRGQY